MLSKTEEAELRKRFDEKFAPCHWCSDYVTCEYDSPIDCKHTLEPFKIFLISAINEATTPEKVLESILKIAE